MSITTLAPSTNGTAATAKKPRRNKTPARPGTTRKHIGRLSARRKVAIAVASVGVTLLVLSVYHCTEGLVVLTGSPVFLAALLAIGIDAGLVVAELAAIVGEDDRKVSRWANAYLVVAILLSAGLNSLANGLHAEDHLWLARGVGLVIPALIFNPSKLTGLL